MTRIREEEDCTLACTDADCDGIELIVFMTVIPCTFVCRHAPLIPVRLLLYLLLMMQKSLPFTCVFSVAIRSSECSCARNRI